MQIDQELMYVTQNHNESHARSPMLPPTIPAVALPNEIPTPPALSQVPARILHSSTVESLLAHIDDLASRLKVHIRQNSQLEAKLIEAELEIENQDHAQATLRAQVDVLREKDRSLSERMNSLDQKTRRAEDEAEFLRIAKTELENKLRFFIKKDLAFTSFRRRCEKWLRPSIQKKNIQIEKLALEKSQMLKSAEQLNATISLLKMDLQSVRVEADRKTAHFDKDKARLVELYEAQIEEAKKESKKAKALLAQALEKVQVMDRVTDEQARTSNDKVFFERKATELETQLKTDREKNREQISSLNAEVATLRAACEQLRELKTAADSERDLALNDRQKFEQQLATLREIWRESSQKIQTLQSQVTSLEGLNQDLSQRLSDARTRASTTDESFDQFVMTETSNQGEQLKKLDLILSDLELKAFGLKAK